MSFSPDSPSSCRGFGKRVGAEPPQWALRRAAFTTLLCAGAWGLTPDVAAQAASSLAASQPFQLQLAADSRMQAPLTVSLSATMPAGYRATWDLGDGSAAVQSNVTHTYYRPGKYTATLRVLDSQGRLAGQASAPLEVRSQGPERAALVVLLGRSGSGLGATLSAEGSVVYAPSTPQFAVDGHTIPAAGPGRTALVPLRPGAQVAGVQLAGASGALSRSVRFSVPAQAPLGSASYENQVWQAINRLRADGYNCATGRFDGPKRVPLVRQPALDRAALAQALAMPVANFMAHTSALDGSTPAQRIAASGYPVANTAENLAAGQPTPEKAVTGWLGSPGHCASLTGDYTEMGLSYVRAPGSTYEHYWVQVFGKPQVPSAGPGAAPTR